MLYTGIKVYNGLSASHIQTKAKQPCTTQDKHRFDVSNTVTCVVCLFDLILYMKGGT